MARWHHLDAAALHQLGKLAIPNAGDLTAFDKR